MDSGMDIENMLILLKTLSKEMKENEERSTKIYAEFVDFIVGKPLLPTLSALDSLVPLVISKFDNFEFEKHALVLFIRSVIDNYAMARLSMGEKSKEILEFKNEIVNFILKNESIKEVTSSKVFERYVVKKQCIEAVKITISNFQTLLSSLSSDIMSHKFGMLDLIEKKCHIIFKNGLIANIGDYIIRREGKVAGVFSELSLLEEYEKI